MTDNNEKLRALVLAALMVFSVFAGTVALTGSAAAANVSDGGIAFQGQTVDYNAQNQDINYSTTRSYTLYERIDSSTGSPVRSLSTNGGWVNVSTNGLETGTTYFISNDGQDPADADLTFTVRAQDFSATFDDDSVNNAGTTNVDIEFESTNRGDTYNVTVTSEDLSDDELVNIYDDNFNAFDADVDGDEEDDDDGVEIQVTDGTQTAGANFSDVDGGEYNFTFEVTDTTAEDTASITVNDIGAGETSFADSNVDVAQGGIANITVEMDGAATSGSLIVGDSDEDGYQANISVEDGNNDGQVSVLFNTYTAGNSSMGTIATAADSDDTVTVEDNESVSELLASGDYTIYTSSSGYDDTQESPDDIGTLFIEERSTDSMQLWTAPGGANLNADEEDGVTESDLSTLIEDGVITQDDTITNGDVVVHQVSATGLEGVIDAEGGLENALENESLQLTIEQTNPVQNRDPKVINALSSGNAITLVEGDGSYYVAVNTASDQLNVTRNGDTSAQLRNGDEYEATFTVADDRLLGSTEEDDHQSVNATFEVEEASTELDSDPVNVTAADDQMITGTTNFAPGTELTIRVRSTDDTQPRFFNTQTAVVQADGSLNASFDFSDQSAGDTFTVTVRKSGSTIASADGNVVESATTETETTETVTETETTETVTETETTETDAPDTETDAPDTETETEETSTDTPGFGVAVALVALLAAALLAGRRE